MVTSMIFNDWKFEYMNGKSMKLLHFVIIFNNLNNLFMFQISFEAGAASRYGSVPGSTKMMWLRLRNTDYDAILLYIIV
jgi:hypothetical protein